MKYALLIYEDESLYGPEKSSPRLQEIATATTVHTRGGKKTVHDGPFAEAREQLGGLYLIDVASLDEAIEIAKQIPLAEDGAIEIRPLLGP
jgi:hypothetical protein